MHLFPPARLRTRTLPIILLALSTTTLAADDRSAAQMGIQLRVLPNCAAQADAEGCVQPAAETPDGAAQPEQISGLSPAMQADSDAGSPPVITRTW